MILIIKVICFDLDGTLLPIDTDAFIGEYLKALAPHVAPVMGPDQLIPLIWDATKAMIESDEPQYTNEQIFERRFLEKSGLKREEIWHIFDHFYDNHFPSLKKHVAEAPLSRQIVQSALDRGYRVAVATNPVFPKAAIQERMRWAGVEDLVEWVSVYEETHWCKPHPGYYREVAAAMGVTPEECIMVGNDMQEDLVASTVGMTTYWVNQHRIDRGSPTFSPDGEGTMVELLSDIRAGKGIFSAVAL
ncbi:FMN phosphatase YigB, HAD superfamily [Marininema mesophilum]|uniref:FMN phosphatase YigB, HAD superfamily n=1 Tax=Marininema mesophilum TaxID=1048340 RepID=A0A1H2RB44_9BACL|nr:HAD family hydrolase [Marininema mesophilum]SDW16074.1 FMN phosphatase YigB, HAD superfamily [Marininema mesophilum]